jgi:hypothetical protein
MDTLPDTPCGLKKLILENFQLSFQNPYTDVVVGIKLLASRDNRWSYVVVTVIQPDGTYSYLGRHQPWYLSNAIPELHERILSLILVP